MRNILKKIKSPRDIKKLPPEKLPELASGIRKKIIDTVSRTGGHLASSLGSVELTTALHYVFDSPRDKIVWDVGHQSYAHKILTGRLERFDTLRQLGGLSGFPCRDESEHDMFTTGHSSTSISAALGLACARDLKNENWKVIAVTGDASLATGMSFEALNHAGHLRKDLMVIISDNERSISKSVGALSRYLNRVMANPVYNRVRRRMQILVKRMPVFGFKAFKAARRLEESLKNLLVPGIFFENLGFRYFGPIDGHNIEALVNTFRNLSGLREPVVVHLITRKGKGYRFAERNPELFHSAPPFDVNTGRVLKQKKDETYTEVFSKKIVELAKNDPRIVAITAAMTGGTGLSGFAAEFPNRFFDVGIAEQHAVGLAAGLAREGFRPVIAVYSTFLQRGYDQLIHDTCLQGLPVIFCIDRAGLVGEDGPTHHGAFDIAYLRHIPEIVIMAPRDGFEFKRMLEFALRLKKPVAIRYPKASALSHIPAASFDRIETGKSELIRKGKDLGIFAVGSMVSAAVRVADILSSDGIEATVINSRFIKPLDREMLGKTAKEVKNIVTMEEGVAAGGFGSAILEFFERENINDLKIRLFGLPDHFITHGKREELLKEYHFTPDEIAQTIKKEFFEEIKWRR